MSEDEGQPRPVASRRQVWRMTRHHLVPLAAMGVAAAESVGVLSRLWPRPVSAGRGLSLADTPTIALPYTKR